MFGGRSTFSPVILVEAEANADLVVQDEGPDETKDQLEVPTHNVSTACMGEVGKEK